MCRRAREFRRNLREAFEQDGPLTIEQQRDDVDLQPVADEEPDDAQP